LPYDRNFTGAVTLCTGLAPRRIIGKVPVRRQLSQCSAESSR